MSKKCEHNNHSHFWLWWAVWMLWMGSIIDCSGERARMKSDIYGLDSKVRSLEFEVAQCKRR